MVSRAKRLGCALLSALGLAAVAWYPSPAIAATSSTADLSAEARLLADVNGDRAALGMGPLIIDPQLVRIARERALYLVAHHAFSHCVDLAATCPPSGYHFAILLRGAGVPFSLAGENLAEDSAPAPQVADSLHADWMQSPAHHEQIVNPSYNATGFGVVCCTTLADDQGTVVGNVSVAVEIFAREPAVAYGRLHKRR